MIMITPENMTMTSIAYVRLYSSFEAKRREIYGTRDRKTRKITK